MTTTENVKCPEYGHVEIQTIPENMTKNEAFKRAMSFKCCKCGWKVRRMSW